MKVIKRFQYEGVELQIVERDEPYMSNGLTVRMTRVIAPNGGIVPVQLKRKQTQKSIVEDTINLLDGLRERGADVKGILTKELPTN